MKVNEAFTTNLCSTNTYRQKEKNAVKCAVETGSGKEGVSWKNVENEMERTISPLDVGAPVKDRMLRVFGSWLTKKSRQEYKVSGGRNRQPRNTWNNKCCHDTDCNESMMKKASPP